MIIDDFFEYPDAIREVLLHQDMLNHTAEDNITYPGIVALPSSIKEELISNLNYLFRNRITGSKCFARYSFEEMSPPNWAHSDFNIAQFVALIYMNPQPHSGDGTHLVRHKSGFDYHPDTDERKDILLSESNDRSKWDITFTCPAVYNRAFIVNAYLLHAAAMKYGTSKANSRLVLTCFFDLD